MPPPSELLSYYSERMTRDRRYDQVLADVGLPGAQWRLGVDRYPNQLGQSDLKAVARGWLKFIQ
ncbi:hypothetical protein AHAS_Ahas19G0263900 [Arachis hypogaea]